MSTLVDQIATLIHRRDAIQTERKRLEEEERRVETEILSFATPKVGLTATVPEHRFKSRGRKPKFSAEALRLISDQPGIAYGALAVGVYGKDTPDARHKVRAMVWAMKKQGRIRPSTRVEGGWEVVESKNGASAMSP